MEQIPKRRNAHRGQTTGYYEKVFRNRSRNHQATFQLSDPSGKNAYLMWMTKAMKDSGAGVYDVPGLARERIFDIVPLVTDFTKQSKESAR
jgi:hypothetical protein